MNYRFIYTEDFDRIVPAVMIDSRQDFVSLQGKTGFQFKALIDQELAKIYSNTLFYKIESENGSVVGYIMVNINTQTLSSTIASFRLRHCFFLDEINIINQANIFVNNGNCLQDYLY